MASSKQRWPRRRKISFVATGLPRSVILIFVLVCISSCGGVTTPHDDHGTSKTEAASLHSGQQLNADSVLAILKAGNEKFVRKLLPGNISHDSSYNYFDQISHTGNEQHPIACILTCMDSRVPPEIIFEQGIGSLFVLRVAGNIEDDDILGSMEYAVVEKHVPLVIVMGHKNCGAIAAAFSEIDPENKELISLIALVKKDVIPNDKPPYDASAR